MKTEMPQHSSLSEMGSDRSFGLIFAVLLVLMALFPALAGGYVRLWALLAASGFLASALVAPQLLRGLNLVWFRFGMLLHHIVTPVVVGLLFFLVLTPLGMLMRATGKDPLRLKPQPGLASYWILRESPGPRPETMKNQF